MKTVKIVPKEFSKEGCEWTGHAVMRLPTFDEKYEYIESLNTEVSEDSIDSEKISTGDQLKHIRKMVSISQKHYVEVCFENKTTGEKVTSFEDMQYEEGLHNVMAEIAGRLIHGFKVGNG